MDDLMEVEEFAAYLALAGIEWRWAMGRWMVGDGWEAHFSVLDGVLIRLKIALNELCAVDALPGILREARANTPREYLFW